MCVGLPTMNLSSVATEQSVSRLQAGEPPAASDEQILDSILRIEDAHAKYAGMDIDVDDEAPEVVAIFTEIESLERKLIAMPPASALGLAYKLTYLEQRMEDTSFQGYQVEFFHRIVKEASRLAGGRDQVIVERMYPPRD